MKDDSASSQTCQPSNKAAPYLIAHRYADPTTNLILDTIARGKQALVFVSSKRSAEKVASDAARKIKDAVDQEILDGLHDKALGALGNPTDQCKKLAISLRSGVAFHHSGLAPKQKELVEDGFRSGHIRIIACTPTLAAGLDMPAFRVIIRDLKRYTGWGYQYIPVLEYQQMSGRAGRPGREDFGEAICIAKDGGATTEIEQQFIFADVEPIYSKLAVEPVLRTYVLSLVASGFVDSRERLVAFFSKTFWAQQYGDMHKLEMIIERVIGMLRSFGFLTVGSINTAKRTDDDGFESAKSLMADASVKATPLGERVAQLYIDPLTADGVLSSLKSASETNEPATFAYLQLLCYTLEMRPLLRIRTREQNGIEDALATYELLVKEPSLYDTEYTDFLSSVKTALCLRDWIDEGGEDLLFDRYGITPGELRAKLDTMDWLCFCAGELIKIADLKQHLAPLTRLRNRLKYGAREELLPLLRFKQIGRQRARSLYGNGIKSSGDIQRASIEKLAGIIGPRIAKSLQEQVGKETTDFSPLDGHGEGIDDATQKAIEDPTDDELI